MTVYDTDKELQINIFCKEVSNDDFIMILCNIGDKKPCFYYKAF